MADFLLFVKNRIRICRRIIANVSTAFVDQDPACKIGPEGIHIKVIHRGRFYKTLVSRNPVGFAAGGQKSVPHFHAAGGDPFFAFHPEQMLVCGLQPL